MVKLSFLRNGVSLKSLKGAEYGCLLDVSTAFPPYKNKERMIQVKAKTLFYFGMPRLWYKHFAQQNRPICIHNFDTSGSLNYSDEGQNNRQHTTILLLNILELVIKIKLPFKYS